MNSSNSGRTSYGPSMHSGHSTRELEHRLTQLEDEKEASREQREELYEIAEEHRNKLTLHEKAILMIVGSLSILLQDKLPGLASLVKGLIP